MAKIKILHFHPLFLPFLGGAEQNIYNFAKHSQHEHVVFTDLLRDSPSFEKINDISVYRVSPARIQSASLIPKEMLLDVIREVNKIFGLIKINYDLMHFHGSYAYPRFFNYFDEKIGHTVLRQIGAWQFNTKPMLATFHSVPSHDLTLRKELLVPPFAPLASRKSWISTERRYCKDAKFVTCVDRYMVTGLKQLCPWLSPNIIHVPSGVDTDLNKPLERAKAFNRLPQAVQDKIGEETFRVLYVGRIESNKGVHYLNSLASQLPSGANLVIAGHGNEYLLKKSERVRYVGPVKNEFVNYLMNSCDVVFNTSVYQGIGRQTFEAMACSKPVIMLDCGDRYPLIQGENGFIVHNSTEALECVNRLRTDQSLYKRISVEALATARKYSVQNMAKIVDRAYEFVQDTFGREGRKNN
jgi:glycosyltransferase involved in cell wall biosynthesis